MTALSAAREMRANGHSPAQIDDALSISLGHAYRAVRGIARGASEAAGTVTRFLPRNGGCSTTSGKVPVTMPRIVALHGAA